MALPDNYTGASPLYGGMSAPGGSGDLSWVPTSGQRASVSLNTISSVYPVNAPDTRTRGSTSILSVWCSTTFVPWLGALGSILVFGGGHGDYLGNEVYRYDLATRLWSRILDPFDIPVSYALGAQATSEDDGPFAGNGVADKLYGEYFTDDSKSAVVPGQLCPPHTYANILAVPPDAAGNDNGWLVMMSNFSKQSHKLDLDNPSAGWARFGEFFTVTGKVESPGYGFAIYDPLRKRIAEFPFTNGAQPYAYSYSLPDGAVTWFPTQYIEAYYGVGYYASADDLYLMMRADKASVFLIHDPKTGNKVIPATSGTAPADNTGGTVGWIDSTRQLYYWPGSGTQVYFLTAPANPLTGTWVWAARDFGGDAPALPDTTWPMYKRLHYVEAKNALVHVGSTLGPVQIWKL
jgi:hypothetical protein